MTYPWDHESLYYHIRLIICGPAFHFLKYYKLVSSHVNVLKSYHVTLAGTALLLLLDPYSDRQNTSKVPLKCKVTWSDVYLNNLSAEYKKNGTLGRQLSHLALLPRTDSKYFHFTRKHWNFHIFVAYYFIQIQLHRVNCLYLNIGLFLCNVFTGNYLLYMSPKQCIKFS